MLRLYGVSGIVLFFSQIFVSMRTSYTILMVLIILDASTRIFTAIKCKRICSKELSKFAPKVIAYTLTIVTVKLLEVILDPLVTTNILSEITLAFLAIKESISILENLTLLGVPLPSNIVPVLIKSLKIPALTVMLENSTKKEREFSDIDCMISYQITTSKDEDMRVFLEIRHDACKSLIDQIMIISENAIDNPDLLFYKVISLVEVTFSETNKKYDEEKIPIKYKENFFLGNECKKDEFIEEMKIICSSDETISKKKEQIVDNIIIRLYQLINDALKGA